MHYINYFKINWLIFCIHQYLVYQKESLKYVFPHFPDFLHDKKLSDIHQLLQLIFVSDQSKDRDWSNYLSSGWNISARCALILNIAYIWNLRFNYFDIITNDQILYRGSDMCFFFTVLYVVVLGLGNINFFFSLTFPHRRSDKAALTSNVELDPWNSKELTRKSQTIFFQKDARYKVTSFSLRIIMPSKSTHACHIWLITVVGVSVCRIYVVYTGWPIQNGTANILPTICGSNNWYQSMR